jgi:hypothetical protein
MMKPTDHAVQGPLLPPLWEFAVNIAESLFESAVETSEGVTVIEQLEVSLPLEVYVDAIETGPPLIQVAPALRTETGVKPILHGFSMKVVLDA